MESHLGLVHHIAGQIARSGSMHGAAEFDDLVGAGVLGLIGAVHRFDPGRGLAFSTFAVPRIRGAILDDLRRRDEVPRVVRSRQRKARHATERLAARLGDRWPKDMELADELGITLPQLRKWLAEGMRADRAMLLDEPFEEGGAAKLRDVIPGADGRGLIDEMIAGSVMRGIIRAILALPAQQREVMCMYFMDQLKLREIAAVMRLTESRICQIKAAAILGVRLRLETAA